MPAGGQITGDHLATLVHAERWQGAMKTMGRAAVEAELRRRPGRPKDLIDDIGGEPPYPTREFCEQWCIDQDNILFQFTPRTGVVLTLLVAVTACLLMAFSDFTSVPSGSAASALGSGRPAAMADVPRSMAAAPVGYGGLAFQPSMPSQQQQQQQQQQRQQQQQLQQQMLQFQQYTRTTSTP